MIKEKLPHDHGDPARLTHLTEQLGRIEDFSSVAECFRLLSDPTRVRIFWLLSHREECGINLAALLGISGPALSHHLRPMRECGLLDCRRDGKEVYYRVAHRDACELLHRFTEQLLAIGCPLSERDGGNMEGLAEEVHRYLLEHLAERVTIEQLSHRFHVNATTLKKKFKERYGDSLAAHIHQHRMERAAELLTNSNTPIGEIAALVGFQGQSRLTVAFREQFGTTPSSYREQVREGSRSNTKKQRKNEKST